MKSLRKLYPEIEPHDCGHLDVGDGHSIYWEVCGNPKGKPAVFLHGGPGGGCNENHRRLFDPKKYKIVLFDQRGCGRSKPYTSIKANTTWHLVADIEKIRKMLDIDKWLVLGGSWGSTLALAYAQKHPNRVTEIILRGVFLGRTCELDWFYKEGGASKFFPDVWEYFVEPLSKAERKDPPKAYHRRFASKNPRVRLDAARRWTKWEMSTCALLPKDFKMTPKELNKFALAFAQIENHYFMHDCFLKKDQLLRGMKKISKIPGVIVQGRYDVICPPTTAWSAHKNWPASKIEIIPDAGHGYDEPGTLDATIRATDAFAKRKGR